MAAHDATRLTEAKDRLVRAEAELAAARAAFESASTRAEVSQRVVCGAEELLPPVADNRGATTDGPSAATGSASRRTIAQEVLAFLRPGHHAARGEITRHFEVMRPDVKPGSLWRELSRLVTKGTLISVARGVYATAPSFAGGDA